MRNYINEGSRITVVAPYNVASGGGMLVGSLFLVALAAAATGFPVEGVPEGQFDLAKATGQAWTQGVKLYWDNTAKNVTTTVAANQLIGAATQAQASADAIGRVYLDGAVR